MDKKTYLTNLASLSSKNPLHEFTGMIPTEIANTNKGIAQSTKDRERADHAAKLKAELEKTPAKEFVPPTPDEAEETAKAETTSTTTDKVDTGGDKISANGSDEDNLDASGKAQKKFLDMAKSGEITTAQAVDYSAQVNQRVQDAIGEKKKREIESAVEKGLDRVADVAEFVPVLGQGVAAAHAASYGARAAMYGDEDGRYTSGAITSGINAVLPSVIGLAGKGLKAVGAATTAGAAKVAPSATATVAKSATAVADKLTKAAEVAKSGVGAASEKIIGTKATGALAKAIASSGNAIGSVGGAYGAFAATENSDIGMPARIAAVIAGGIVGGKAVNLGHTVPGLGKNVKMADVTASIGKAASSVAQAIPRPTMPTLPSIAVSPALKQAVKQKLRVGMVAASIALQGPAAIGPAATHMIAPQTAIASVERAAVREAIPISKTPIEAPTKAPTPVETQTKAPIGSPVTSQTKAPDVAKATETTKTTRQTEAPDVAKETKIARENTAARQVETAPVKEVENIRRDQTNSAKAEEKIEPKIKNDPIKLPKQTPPPPPIVPVGGDETGEGSGSDGSFAGRQYGYERTLLSKRSGVIGSRHRGTNAAAPRQYRAPITTPKERSRQEEEYVDVINNFKEKLLEALTPKK